MNPALEIFTVCLPGLIAGGLVMGAGFLVKPKKSNERRPQWPTT
jgi:hypothetical protein